MGYTSQITDLIRKLLKLPQKAKRTDALLESSRKVLINDEGYRETPYLDTKGNYTIGVGYLIGKSMTELRLTRPTIMFMLTEQVEICIKELIEIFGSDDFYSWEMPRQIALVSMIYTLGKRKFLGFENMISAIKMEDWHDASDHALDSKWASDVDPRNRVGLGRDDRIAFMLREGEFHEDYQIN